MRRRTARVAAALLAGGMCLTACSGGDDGGPSRTRSGSGASTGSAPAVPTEATIATVTGRLPADQRDTLTKAVADIVDGWWDTAYLGDFPRTDFSAAFAGFTPGAAAKARRDLAMMSNASISDRIRSAQATSRSVSLDVLAVKQRPVGVTATVDLAFETTGAVAGPQEVTGTLDLTPHGDGWKVFGFEITRTPTPAAPAAAPTATPESAS